MKLIIKLGIFLAILLSSLLSPAQSKSDKIFDMYSGKEGVTTISFSRSVLKPFEIFIDDDTKKVIYKMKKIRFLAYNEEKGNIDSYSVFSRILNELDGSEYFTIDPEELDCDDCNIEIESDDDLHLIGRGNRKSMDEFHVLVFDNDDCILFSFYGDITIDDLKECGRFTHSTKAILTL